MIVVYSKPGCVQCQFTKEYLKNHEIPFEERDVSVNASALHEMEEMGFRGLPLVVADGMSPFVGFDVDRLEQLEGMVVDD